MNVCLNTRKYCGILPVVQGFVSSIDLEKFFIRTFRYCIKIEVREKTGEGVCP